MQNSKGGHNDAYGPPDQTHILESTTNSLRSQTHMLLIYQSSDRSLAVAEPTCPKEKREQMLRATLYSRLAYYQYELNHGPTGHDNMTNKSVYLCQSKHKTSSNGSTATPTEMCAVDLTNPTHRTPPKSRSKISVIATSHQLQCPEEVVRAPLGSIDNSLYDISKVGSGDNACLAADAYKDLPKHMLRMRAEICQMIMDMMFEEAFGPRRVHPHKDPPIMNIFLAMHRKVYHKFYEQYWTKNTWVISKGPLNKTMRFMTEKPYNDTTTEFSLQIPNKAALRIQIVELSFSNADTPDLNEWHQLTLPSASDPYMNPSHFSFTMQARHNGYQAPQTSQGDIAGSKRVQHCDESQHQLVHTWQDKFDRIAMLNLRHLTLDFTEAYDTSGLFLGVDLVRRLIPFAHGMPATFKILAPDIWIEIQIRDAFLKMNSV